MRDSEKSNEPLSELLERGVPFPADHASLDELNFDRVQKEDELKVPGCSTKEALQAIKSRFHEARDVLSTLGYRQVHGGIARKLQGIELNYRFQTSTVNYSNVPGPTLGSLVRFDGGNDAFNKQNLIELSVTALVPLAVIEKGSLAKYEAKLEEQLKGFLVTHNNSVVRTVTATAYFNPARSAIEEAKIIATCLVFKAVLAHQSAVAAALTDTSMPSSFTPGRLQQKLEAYCANAYKPPQDF